jgi:prevent-host-death family protein
MKDTWQLQTAKAKFSQVVELCAEDGPQTITKHGRPVAHIISHDDYELLRRPVYRVDVRAKEQRRKRIFGDRQLKGNAVLESRR